MISPKKPNTKTSRTPTKAPAVSKRPAAASAPDADVSAPDLLTDLRQLIEQARQLAAVAVNAGLSLMYWRIGQRIRTEVLGGQRASYGAEIVATLSRQLVADYGRGFEEKSLRRMVQFAEVYPDEHIVLSLIRHLSWTHFLVLLPLKEPLARDFYAQMCSIEHWSVRTLRERVDSMLFERTALSRKPDELIRLELDALQAQGDVTPPLLLKDPYVLDFLALDDRYLEKGLENATLRELEHFLLELGDLPPLGIILCTGKKNKQIELLELDKSGIHVAEYLTVLPPREVFQQKIQQALAHAKSRLANQAHDTP